MGTEKTARAGEARRGELARRERELASLASQQHGVISRSQLLGAGLGLRTIRRRVSAGRLRILHRGVYAFGPGRVSQSGHWMAAVLACGDGALLSHRSAADLWGLMRSRRPLEVTAPRGRYRAGIAIHECGLAREDRTVRDGIPVTTVARTLFDLSEVAGESCLERAFEEADRLHLLEMRRLEEVCARSAGRRALRPSRRLLDMAQAPTVTRSALEDRFARLCDGCGLPPPSYNVSVLDHEVDVLWPRERLIVELDGFAFHGYRAAFERDRVRDAALQVAGYRVLRLTYRRLTGEPDAVADEIRRLLEHGAAGL